MTRIQLACYALLASAAVLAGLLLVQINSHVPAAEAAMVIARDNYSLMTASTRQGEEALFIVVGDKLLIYTTDLRGARGRLNLSRAADLGQIFAALPGAGAPGGAPGGGARPR
ncbi:MAG: hypothetical protein WD042_08505 [Phycisphaeraceae bacterium]